MYFRATIALFVGLLSLGAVCIRNNGATTEGALEGTVFDTTIYREPVVGASVVLKGTRIGAVTDKHGAYHVRKIPPGDYSLRVIAVGYDPVEILGVHISPGQTARLVVKIVPLPPNLFHLPYVTSGTFPEDSTGWLEGCVTDSATHEPLIGVSVQLRGTEFRVFTDLNGNYKITRIPKGRWSVSFSSVGFITAEQQAVQILTRQANTLNIRMAIGWPPRKLK
jgi:hypothetical protein